MWTLKPLEPGGETHYLLPSKQYVVGRKNCDIILPNDQSISRAHAHLTATDQTLTLKDSSKYGTFVNSQRLSENEPMNLKSGDNVTFGVFHSKFSVDCQKVVVCSSCLDNDGKASLSRALLPLGGKLVNSWTQDCTHLVMPTVKVTIKTISALLCCRPIVKQEFFTELSKALQQKLTPPKAESFIPEIDEPSLSKEGVDLGVIPVRKQLFAGKTFLFLSGKQLKRLSTAVGFGGGRSQLLEEGSLPRGLLESPQSCVIDVSTGNSQALLPSTTTEWANSVRRILQQKGLRVITESEIGLAAIYASCDKYCNPSGLTPDSESIQNMKPRIASATLSQNTAVDETVLPAASQNITAYALNTEPTQGMELSEVTGVMAVGETPEKRQNRNTSQLGQSRSSAQEMGTTSVVADTMSSSLTTGEKTGLQRKKPESKLQGGRNDDARSQPSFPKASGGTRTYPQWGKSPQKQKTSAQVSPQKQSTLTNFFQPVSKKRPLEDEPSAVMSEPKRAVPTSSSATCAPTSSLTSKQTPSLSDKLPTARAQSQLGSGADLFIGQSEALSDRVSHPAQQGPRGRKRKEMEAEIQMEELESIMSEDMDYLDEQTSDSQGQQAQRVEHRSAEQKKALNAEEPSSTSKRKRGDPEENGKTNQKPCVGLEKDLASNRNQSLEIGEHSSSTKRQQLPPSENRTTNQMSSKPPADGSSASKSQHLQPFKDEDVSYVVDAELLDIDLGQPKGEQETPLKPAAVKHEAPVSEADEDLPKRLVLVEFKSLTVAAPPKTKPLQRQGNCYAKNFKCFSKIPVPGAEDSPHIIGGSDLLAHNRGKNSDLDEWLRDAAEEERQSKREESVGDDLFRYNPTKLTKRR
ncbi:nibrin [Centroberyx affinis]|uniref:nibrin n=1 Tax=Centroberyx affinis TaxID=166261 RepID=UPI003A5BCBCA